MSESQVGNGQDAHEYQHRSHSDSHERRETEEPDDEIRLLDLLIVLAKHKFAVLGFPIAAAIIAAIYSLFLPSIYTGTTKLLPPQQNQSVSSAIFSQVGGGLGALAGVKSNNNDLYVGMLKSRTVADNLIQRFDLMKLFGAKYPSQARAALSGATTVVAGKDGIITIEVEALDPQRAADLANGYAEELTKLTQVLAVTEASQRRLFFERQFAQAKESLAKAEVLARRALQQGGLVKVDEQGRAMVETTARLRGEIAVKEVQIGAMRAFASEDNAELKLAERELAALKTQLSKFEGTSTVKGMENAIAIGGRGLDNLRLLRDLKYSETVYELLARQFEVAKIDEAKDSAVVQVLDAAIAPDLKSKPNRRNIVLFATIAALLAGIIWVFVAEVMGRTLRDPEQVARLHSLRRYLSWR